MAKAMTVEWLDAASGAAAGVARPPYARVLICDLRDRALETLRALAPDANDIEDANYPGASERSHFLARRATLRSFAARCAGADPHDIRIFYDGHGAPRVAGPRLFVSVSSRGARAALAVASSPVGVDLEPFDETAPVIEDVIGKAERLTLAKLAGPARAAAFLRIWTAKEAYLKALGSGFKRDPARICIRARAGGFTVEDTSFAAVLAAGAYAPQSLHDNLIVACAVLPVLTKGTTP